MTAAGETVKQWVHEFLDKKDRKNTFKVLLIGDSVGKSSLVLRFCSDEFFEESSMQFIPMTLGLDVKLKALEIQGSDGKEEVQLQLWDTAGQNRFRQFNEQYLPSADAIVLLYDVRNVQTFKDCRRFVEDVKKFCDTNVIKVLVGNKDDEDESRKSVPSEHGADFAKFIDYEFMETSAKDNKNVQELFRKVAQLCLERPRRKDSKEDS